MNGFASYSPPPGINGRGDAEVAAAPEGYGWLLGACVGSYVKSSSVRERRRLASLLFLKQKRPKVTVTARKTRAPMTVPAIAAIDV